METIRVKYVLCPDGRRRTVTCPTPPDSFYSAKGRIKYRGRTVSGLCLTVGAASCGDDDREFVPTGKHADIFGEPDRSGLVNQHIAEDGTIFGEDQFRNPCYFPPGSSRYVSAPTGMILLEAGREWVVVEYDPADYPLTCQGSQIGIAREWRMAFDLLLDKVQPAPPGAVVFDLG